MNNTFKFAVCTVLRPNPTYDRAEIEANPVWQLGLRIVRD